MIFNNKSWAFLLLAIIFFPYCAIAADKSSDNSEQVEKQKFQGKKVYPPIKGHRILIYRDCNCEEFDELHDHLKRHNIEYHDIDLSWNRKQRMILERKAGKSDKSYIFIGNKYIGNHNDLMLILKQGKLQKIIHEE